MPLVQAPRRGDEPVLRVAADRRQGLARRGRSGADDGRAHAVATAPGGGVAA